MILRILPWREVKGNGQKNTLYCWRSSTVEQLICNQQVVGSSPIASFLLSGKVSQYGTERCPSGQREQTVNLPAYAFEGSNPSLSTLNEDESRRE